MHSFLLWPDTCIPKKDCVLKTIDSMKERGFMLAMNYIFLQEFKS